MVCVFHYENLPFLSSDFILHYNNIPWVVFHEKNYIYQNNYHFEQYGDFIYMYTPCVALCRYEQKLYIKPGMSDNERTFTLNYELPVDACSGISQRNCHFDIFSCGFMTFQLVRILNCIMFYLFLQILQSFVINILENDLKKL